MKLGDFRKLTANLSDDTDIVVEYYDEEEEGSVAMPTGKITVKSNKDIWLGQRFSETVVFIEDSGCR